MRFSEILFPNFCPVCSLGMEIGQEICPECKEKIEKLVNLNPPKILSGGYLLGEHFAFYYEDAVKKSIANYKFQKQIGIHKFYKTYFDRAFQKVSEIFDYDFVMAVPVSDATLVKRGFDQSKILLSDLNIENKKKIKNIIKKKNNVKSQHLLSKSERKKNVKDAFYLGKSFDIQNKNIILIDDIRTTGYTANEVAKILIKQGKAKQIFLLTLARASE
ncbi:MAG: hypothetical protein Q4E28_04460 [Clostridia bacterium]|nr:hypothetical protein [Clostridia bacterium]